MSRTASDEFIRPIPVKDGPSLTEPNPPDDDHPEFDNESRWPRRLLHVPSLTSFKWQPGNSYGGHKEPKYVALSYTWGRWALDGHTKQDLKPLQIQGVPWLIPRVDPSIHFAVAEFAHIIDEVTRDPSRYYRQFSWKGRKIGDQTVCGRAARTLLKYVSEHERPPYEYLWLDIACIDQRYSGVTMAEIGRQARIFQHAEHCYVWLSRLPHTELKSLLSDLQSGALGLETEPYIQGQSRQQASQTKAFMILALGALKGLTKDPWFTSLWTLQEAYLCPRAIILSREGKPVSDLGSTWIIERSQTLGHIFSFVNNLSFWSGFTRAPGSEIEYSQLVDLVHTTGLAALWKNNPMALLGVSHARTATRQLDRIYGIMQVFGTDFKVGDARPNANENHAYTLLELEDEFGAAIIDKYPILSQMHVYLEKPAFGKGWCVQASSTVPEILERGDMFGWSDGASNRLNINTNIQSHTMCELTTRKAADIQWAYLSGKACSFPLLQREWRQADRSEFAKTKLRSYWRMHRRSRPSIMLFSLDRGYRFEDLSTEQRVSALTDVEVEEQEHELAAWIAKQFHQHSLVVFLLGRCDFGDEAFNSGVILFQREEQGIQHWHRIGVCNWLISHLVKDGHEYPNKALLSGESKEWQHVEGLFG